MPSLYLHKCWLPGGSIHHSRWVVFGFYDDMVYFCHRSSIMHNYHWYQQKWRKYWELSFGRNNSLLQVGWRGYITLKSVSSITHTKYHATIIKSPENIEWHLCHYSGVKHVIHWGHVIHMHLCTRSVSVRIVARSLRGVKPSHEQVLFHS